MITRLIRDIHLSISLPGKGNPLYKLEVKCQMEEDERIEKIIVYIFLLEYPVRMLLFTINRVVRGRLIWLGDVP